MILREEIIKYNDTGIKVSDEKLDDPELAAKIIRDFFVEKGLDHEKEHFFALLLNKKNILIAIEIVSIGNESACLVSPSQVFKTAIRAGACALIISHNHPSGEVLPSRADLMVTEELKKGGNILKIDILDHIIFNTHNEEIYSFQRSGLL